MNINLETANKYAVQAYSDTQIQIDSVIYQDNLIVCAQGINLKWELTTVSELDEDSLAPLLAYNPEIIIIGHNSRGKFAPPAMTQLLNSQRIGLECMSIGAACRTYNVLLSENRKVVLGTILCLP